MSNNDDALPMTMENHVAGFKYYAFENPGQRAIAKRIGELAWQHGLKSQVILWIRTHPKRFAWLTLQRMYYFWFLRMKRHLQTIVMALLSLASIPALISPSPTRGTTWICVAGGLDHVSTGVLRCCSRSSLRLWNSVEQVLAGCLRCAASA